MGAPTGPLSHDAHFELDRSRISRNLRIPRSWIARASPAEISWGGARHRRPLSPLLRLSHLCAFSFPLLPLSAAPCISVFHSPSAFCRHREISATFLCPTIRRAPGSRVSFHSISAVMELDLTEFEAEAYGDLFAALRPADAPALTAADAATATVSAHAVAELFKTSLLPSVTLKEVRGDVATSRHTHTHTHTHSDRPRMRSRPCPGPESARSGTSCRGATRRRLRSPSSTRPCG